MSGTPRIIATDGSNIIFNACVKNIICTAANIIKVRTNIILMPFAKTSYLFVRNAPQLQQ